MAKKILVATEKPFAGEAVEKIRTICSEAGYEFILLEKYPDHSDLVNAVKDVNALIIRSDKVTREVLDNAAALEIVVRAGAGYDNVDCAAATSNNIVVMNTPGQNSNAVAELAFGMMVYMARGQFNGKPGTELKGKKLGIHAFGNVGVNVARIAQGFGMEVVAYDPYVPEDAIKEHGVTPLDSVEEMYKTCDYISLHLPSIPETQRFVNRKLLSIMKKGATLINTARKEVVCEDGILEVLAAREDLKYASDIMPVKYEEMQEKLGNRVYSTPKKMGAQTKEANVNAGVAAIIQIKDFFEKGDTTFQVNK
ncbi:MAG: 3-phosphoglycerate dehydrogenase [Candidatus Cloacimonas sp. SDB]|nr:MAG: 3-phosphoglycerate dehydrogenase [Candidatus Cloacimonas sp. SDB]